jgi:predicted porin
MFSFNGFVQGSLGLHNNRCLDCQAVGPTEGKDKLWADEIKQGVPYKTVTTLNYQVQPFLGVKFDLGKGYKLSGLLSQRWRDGIVDGSHVYDDRAGSKEDVPGFWYDKNISLSHEDYGRLTIGHMLTRSWREADYPFGSNVGLSEVWASSGSGYGMLTNAIRYQTRVLDFAEGDLILEATYDRGNTDFKKNKPSFLELHAKYYRGPMELDVILQDTKNGGPGAWGHNPFTGLMPTAEYDAALSGSSQNMAMFMGRYWVTPLLELSAGLRRNSWSGANAVLVNANDPSIDSDDVWNNMFNVNWGGAGNLGYAATSYDVIVGARYRMGKWTPSIGVAHLGTASTNNPSERGQSNSALFGVVGLQYDYGNGLSVDMQAGAVRYAQLGLSPMSMPGNDSFTSVDSRINRNGRWFTVEMTYSF